MKKAMMFASMLAVSLVICSSPAAAEEYTYTTTTFDPVLEAYRYTVPANSWYSAKVKPKLNMQVEAKAPVVAQPPVSQPTATAAPFLDENIANSAIAKSPESVRALPFWQDIPVSQQ